ncbi:MAG: ComF family protein [Desulfuromonadales bacterium]|nr:ComF family protein [Desulfuromonadales bacterium]MDT8423783.1 ComF family protein [Desulfuromonadales bacterium]
MTITGWLHFELTGLFDLLLPPLCLACRQRGAVDRTTMLCAECRQELPRYLGARCRCCALPFAAAAGTHFCAGCLRHPPAFSQIYFHGIYTHLLRDVIHRFKYQEDISLARPLGRLLLSTAGEDIDTFRPEVIVPVPLHPARIRQRCYNQALLVARELARNSRCPVPWQALRRIRPTLSQQGLPAATRRKNVRGAFAADGQHVDGKRVLLVDDVMTTGATLNECARTLRRAGAQQVAAAVVARVDREPALIFE